MQFTVAANRKKETESGWRQLAGREFGPKFILVFVAAFEKCNCAML